MRNVRTRQLSSTLFLFALERLRSIRAQPFESTLSVYVALRAAVASTPRLFAHDALMVAVRENARQGCIDGSAAQAFVDALRRKTRLTGSVVHAAQRDELEVTPLGMSHHHRVIERLT